MQKSHFMAREGEVRGKGGDSSCVTAFVRSFVRTLLFVAQIARMYPCSVVGAAPQTIASGAGRRKSLPFCDFRVEIAPWFSERDLNLRRAREAQGPKRKHFKPRR